MKALCHYDDVLLHYGGLHTTARGAT